MQGRYRLYSRVVSVVALGVVLSACDIAVNGEGGFRLDARGRAQDEWTRSYSIPAGGRLELINVNGRITAEASDAAMVEIRGERVARAATDEGAQDLLGRLEIREEVGDERVRVEVRPPRMSGASGHEVKWTVRVPRGVAVDLRTVNGGVRMTGLHGDVRARSTNGGITAKNLTATTVDVSVTNGGIEIELAQAVSSGSFQLQAVNGGVTLLLPDASKADVVARCVNGGISVSGFDLEPTGEQTRRRVDGKLNGGGARVSLETVNGGVKIGRAS
jgi:hypothetical protein